MQDKRSRGENSLRDGGIRAGSSLSEFRHATSELDVEERIERDIQRRALERFRSDDDYEVVTPRRDLDY